MPLRQLLAGQLAIGLDGRDYVPALLANPFHQLGRGVPRVEQHVHGIRFGEERNHLLQHLTRQFQLALVAQLGVLAAAVESPDGAFAQIRTPRQGEMKGSPMNAQDDMIAGLDGSLLVMIEMPIDALESAVCLCPLASRNHRGSDKWGSSGRCCAP